MRKAFTLLELMMVIVIMGMISYMGIEAVLNIYRNYLQSRAINTLETQTELVLEQIAKRLSIRVRGSTIGKQASADGLGAFVPTQGSGLNSTYPILEWVAYSYESFQDGGWSGFVDLNGAPTSATKNAATNSGTLSTPGSRLVNQAGNWTSANQNISDLTQNRATIANNNIGLMFRGTNLNINSSFGYNHSVAQSIALVTNDHTATTDTVLSIKDYRGTVISEQYYLLHTAYAVVPGANSANGDFDLFLYYNFRPWVNNQEYVNGSRDLLATNVTRFNFTEVNNVLVLKLCIRDAGRSLNPTEAETTVCKTKAVY